MVVLNLLNAERMHGYKIITVIRRRFDVYFGPSTVYPLLNMLEKEGCITSIWDMSTGRPKKVYELTAKGRNLMQFTEESLNFICRKIGTSGVTIEVKTT